MNNNQIIEKASMMLNDLATGGLMNQTQFNTFYRNIIDSPTILNEARTVQMPIDSMKIEKIGFGQRILAPGIEDVAPAKKDKPTTSMIELNAKEVIAEVNITYDTLENNIEKDRLYDTIMQMLAGRVALDLEELVVNGDKDSTDPYLALVNGIRKQATSHVVDFESAMLDRKAFKKAYGAVPTKYLRDPQAWRYYTSYANELEWKDNVTTRQTSLGDNTLQGGRPNAYGIPVKGIAMMQKYDNGAGTDVSDIILTHPKNILVGLSRNVRVEVDKDIRHRRFIIVVTAKIDTVFEEEDAVAKVTNVQAEV